MDIGLTQLPIAQVVQKGDPSLGRGESGECRLGGSFMKRTIAVVLVLCAGALLPNNAVAQQKTLKEQLVGNWNVVSIKEVYPDGHADTPWGV